jgi:S1-C subfamily serine protease
MVGNGGTEHEDGGNVGKTLKQFGVLGVRLFGAALLLVSLFNLSAPAHQPGPQESIIARSLAASVQLHVDREGGVRRWGSGVVLTRDGDRRTLILTAAHLVVPAVSQTVHATTPGGGRSEAAIVAIDETADVAVLAAEDLAATPIALQDTVGLGDNVWVVSFPWGRRGTVVSGVVSQIEAGDAADTNLPISGPVSLIDAAVSYGTSGGGVFDARTGLLVGIVRGYRTAKLSLPGAPAQTLDLPIAGETTVISTATIRCLLGKLALDDADKARLLVSGPVGCADS